MRVMGTVKNLSLSLLGAEKIVFHPTPDIGTDRHIDDISNRRVALLLKIFESMTIS